jgi:hypothetical protein
MEKYLSGGKPQSQSSEVRNSFGIFKMSYKRILISELPLAMRSFVNEIKEL